MTVVAYKKGVLLTVKVINFRGDKFLCVLIFMVAEISINHKLRWAKYLMFMVEEGENIAKLAKV